MGLRVGPHWPLWVTLPGHGCAVGAVGCWQRPGWIPAESPPPIPHCPLLFPPCSEAVRAEPAAGHHALRQLLDAGRLHRHYTLNIDGLADQVGMATWHHERNPGGVTVEMHGNVRHLVCPECHATLPVDAGLAKQVGGGGEQGAGCVVQWRQRCRACMLGMK